MAGWAAVLHCQGEIDGYWAEVIVVLGWEFETGQYYMYGWRGNNGTED
jgi:hypothetical protein